MSDTKVSRFTYWNIEQSEGFNELILFYLIVDRLVVGQVFFVFVNRVNSASQLGLVATVLLEVKLPGIFLLLGGVDRIGFK